MTRVPVVLARLALVALATAAAYGVYTFSLLHVPMWVALVTAAAFELTYIALAFAANATRARWVAMGAVVVSVLYNTLSALFARRPDVLIGAPLWAEVVLAVLHGVPLAVVAYQVAQLLHEHDAPRRSTDAVPTHPASRPDALTHLPTQPDAPALPEPTRPDARASLPDAPPTHYDAPCVTIGGRVYDAAAAAAALDTVPDALRGRVLSLRDAAAHLRRTEATVRRRLAALPTQEAA